MSSKKIISLEDDEGLDCGRTTRDLVQKDYTSPINAWLYIRLCSCGKSGVEFRGANIG